MAESFFSTLEFELDVETEKRPRTEVVQVVSEYIDGYYNCERCHSTVGSMSPIAFERRYLANRTNERHGDFAPRTPLEANAGKPCDRGKTTVSAETGQVQRAS